MQTGSKVFIEYFVDNFLKELKELAKFEAGDHSKHRGAKIFDDSEEEGREYGVKFLGLLGECLRNWGTTLDENIKGISEIQACFYELMDIGAVQFTDKNDYYDLDIVKADELSGHRDRVETEENLFEGFEGDVGYDPLPSVKKIGKKIFEKFF